MELAVTILFCQYIRHIQGKKTVFYILYTVNLVNSSYNLLVLNWRTANDKREKSTLIFCAIPASFYVIARIYFGVAFLILDKTVPTKLKKYGILVFKKFPIELIVIPYYYGAHGRVDSFHSIAIGCIVWSLLPTDCQIATACYIWDDFGGNCGSLIWSLQTRDNKGNYVW